MTPSSQNRLAGKGVIFTAHAIKRMFERGISERGVCAVANSGEEIERYPDDEPYPSMLLLGWVNSRPLHVLLAEDVLEETIIVVTVYEPDDLRWQPGFKRRRSS